jgi:hypothetical protein
MNKLRTYLALSLLLIFGSYYAGVSMFAHTHIAHGSSVVHSHFGGETEHDHSDDQYVVIDLLSNFQSECASGFFGLENQFFTLSDYCAEYVAPAFLSRAAHVIVLRGPPQA